MLAVNMKGILIILSIIALIALMYIIMVIVRESKYCNMLKQYIAHYNEQIDSGEFEKLWRSDDQVKGLAKGHLIIKRRATVFDRLRARRPLGIRHIWHSAFVLRNTCLECGGDVLVIFVPSGYYVFAYFTCLKCNEILFITITMRTGCRYPEET